MKDRIEEYTKHYYTGNHLSSTQLVTDGTGVAVQQVEYAPFGEVVNEYNIDWSNGQVPDFKFNAKELDEENGMYYFEARYQSPPVFISRDVMFEKYPTLSPYSYCANNPLIFADPTGMLIDDVFSTSGKFLGRTKKGNNIVISTSVEAAEKGDFIALSTYLVWGGQRKDILEPIMTHYAKSVVKGDKNEIKMGFEDPKVLAYTDVEGDGQIYFNSTLSNVHLLDNYANIKSILFHENQHQYPKKHATPLEHANIYLKQILHETFRETTKDFKDATVRSFMKYCEDAKNVSRERNVLSLIDKFNSENKHGYYLQAQWDKKRQLHLIQYENQ